MGKLDFDIGELFDAYVKATQYIMRQTFNEDEFVHFSGVAKHFFRADFIAFFDFFENLEPALSQCSNPEPEFRREIVMLCTKTAKDVLESDFISVDKVSLTAGQTYRTISLPLHISIPATVVLVGYTTEEPLSKDLLNLYLALVAMIETVRMRSKEIEARALAQRDLLTTLYNKLTTERLIDTFLKNDGIAGKHALIMLDIDNFKQVNDNLGHMMGDKVLRDFAERLKISFRDTDILGRIGGDEFVVLMKNYKEQQQIIEKIEDLGLGFEKSYHGKSDVFMVTLSMGIALYPCDGICFEKLYINADKALYQSKESGKNTYSFYSANKRC
ncbi:MAG: putative signaling protein [Candidatus Dichloromethanomonas elyunquensis]|nr:MAG: putative signaling protein [Candidatus Dichloromethanomonas elyunquensis]